ncbi:PepSY-like domain-containing protein [Flavobacterium agricola]|uniref:PepSY-like domain-containing protein n=1 Tax=Flavobacterium agricola TaxID=2870839 RepID=A0ABY6M1R0_9FLAO|nr:PepSY-like domain-containing protein [Flavobacterium agricola]UYW02509.1 PepSY-like domain-containing protein [Flavobacterium agricola]
MKKSIKLFLLVVLSGLIWSCKKDKAETNANQVTETTTESFQDNSGLQDEAGLTSADFIAKYFPNESLTDVKNTDDGFEITLTNGTEIEFDLNGNLLQVEGNGKAIPHELVPAKIVEYANKNSKTPVTILEYEYKNQVHEINLSNGKEYKFDSDLNLMP